MRFAPFVLLFAAYSFSARAEIRMADARICDTNRTANGEVWMSWAAVDSNLIQVWQETYGERRDAGEVPPCGTGTALTRAASVYSHFLQGWNCDGYSYLANGLSWWMQGKEYSMPFGTTTFPIPEPKSSAGYFNDVFGPALTIDENHDIQGTLCFRDSCGTDLSVRTGTTTGNLVSNAELKNQLDAAFTVKGQAAGLGIYTHDADTGNTLFHALTCWGYEAGEDGTINTLWVTDSLDGKLALREMSLNSNGGLAYVDDAGGSSTKNLYLKSVTALDTPSRVVKTAFTGIADSEEQGNVVVSGAQVVEHGIIMGEGRALMAEEGSSLTISNAVDVGLTIAADATARLFSTTIQGAKGLALRADGDIRWQGGNLVVQNNAGGVEVSGIAKTSDTSVSISNNIGGAQGGGLCVLADGRVELSAVGEPPDISFTCNTATEKGGAIYNKGIVVIESVRNVTFSGNEAGQGSAVYNEGQFSLAGCWGDVVFEADTGSEAALIYNSGNMQMGEQMNYDSTSVRFVGGSCAIDNTGTLYLSPCANMYFEGNSLKSEGVTYLGCDAEGVLDLANPFIFTKDTVNTAEADSASIKTQLTRQDNLDAAVLIGAELGAERLMAVGEGASSLSNAVIDSTAGFAVDGVDLSTVTMVTVGDLVLSDSTCSADSALQSSATISLDRVTMQLNAAEGSPQTDFVTLDMSGHLKAASLTGTLTLEIDDISALMGDHSLLALSFDENTRLQPELVVSATGFSYRNTVDSTIYFTLDVPEPATATLSLLVLAGVTARRRRKMQTR